MKTNQILNGQSAAVAVLFLSALEFQPSTVFAAGPLTPPGPPAPIWKSLQEIEPRTIIASVPYTVTTPGSYYLSNNLTAASGSAIMIQDNLNGVTLDLNGFTISSTDPGNTGIGILIGTNDVNISIVNGMVSGAVTNHGGGSYSGPGFLFGIYGLTGSNIRISHVSVSGCLDAGIQLSTSSSVVEESTVNTVGGGGITAEVVESCSADGCGSTGIDASEVSDSSGQCAYLGDGIDAQTVINSYGIGAGGGYGVNAQNAQNCYGYALEGTGLFAATANNCRGYTGDTTTNNYGLFAYLAVGCLGDGGWAGLNCINAQSCYGYSPYGYGLFADGQAENSYGQCDAASSSQFTGMWAYTANNCRAYSVNNAALRVVAANNCYGISVNNYGIDGSATSFNGPVENCYGSSQNSSGINAYVVNNCYGVSQYGDGMDAEVVNNCVGVSNAGGEYADGIYAAESANNSYGSIGSSSSAFFTYALTAVTVNNCHGINQSSGSYGVGVSGTSLNNCRGLSYSPSGYGVSGNITIGCWGDETASGGTGLSATLANSCLGYGATPESVTYKYNMP